MELKALVTGLIAELRDDFVEQVLDVDSARLKLHLSLSKALGVQETVHRPDRLQERSPHRVQVIDGFCQLRLPLQFAFEHFDHQEHPVQPAAEIMGKEREIFALGLGCGLELMGLVIDKRKDRASSDHIQRAAQRNDFIGFDFSTQMRDDLLDHDGPKQVVLDEDFGQAETLMKPHLAVLGHKLQKFLGAAGTIGLKRFGRSRDDFREIITQLVEGQSVRAGQHFAHEGGPLHDDVRRSARRAAAISGNLLLVNRSTIGRLAIPALSTICVQIDWPKTGLFASRL